MPASKIRIEITVLGNALSSAVEGWPSGGTLLDVIRTSADLIAMDRATALVEATDGTLVKVPVTFAQIHTAAGMDPAMQLTGMHRDYKDDGEGKISLSGYS